MSSNKKLILEHLTETDRSKLAPHLTDDVEWVEWVDGVPETGAVQRGKSAYIQNPGDDRLRIEILRMTEEDDVVVAEGICHVTKKDGKSLRVRFVDVFEVEKGKIKRKSSFGALLKESG